MFNDKTFEYWIELAKHDIDTVSILIKEKGYPDIILYHIHQSVEKILKSEFIINNKEILFIHDLNRLYKILSECNSKYYKIEDEIITLQSFYNNLRYPQSDLICEDDLKISLKAYNKILSFFNLS